MTAIEAMIYCLGFIHDGPEDGEYWSQIAYDKNGYAHWFSWSVSHLRSAVPNVCSEVSIPFAAVLEPYRVSK